MQIREGLEQQKWLKLFTKLINEEGGWKIAGERYKIEYIFYNDEYNAEKARAAAERLIFKDGVKHIINQWGGAPVLATIKVSDPNKVLTIGTAISDEPCKPQYQYAYKAVEPVPFVTAVSMSAVADYAKRGLKTVVYTTSDDVTGHSMSDKDNISIPKFGMKVIQNFFWQQGMVDFGPLATKVKALNPDLVWMGATTGENITKQVVALRDAGYKGKFFIDNLHAGVVRDIVSKIGPEYLEGTNCSFYDVRQYQKDPEIVRYLKAYEKEYGEFNIEGIHWMAGWFAFKGAVEATQSLDVEVLKKYLDSNPAPVRTLTGWRTAIGRPDLNNLRKISAINSLWRGIMKDGKVGPDRLVGSTEMYKTWIQAIGMNDIYEKYWKEHGHPKFPD